MRGITALAVASGLLLTACGGATTEAQLATDACGLLSELSEAGPELLMDETALEDLEADFTAIEERAQDDDIDDEAMEQAMRDECPEIVESFGSLVGG